MHRRFRASVRPTAGLLLGAIVGIATGCILQLDGAIACGDGHVDRAAGEQCDPLVPSSYQDACRDTPWPMGEGGCDPTTCRLLNGREDCGACGDGKIDAGEECDDTFHVIPTCMDGSEKVRCVDCRLDFSRCPPCGNGQVDSDLGEECDPNADGDFVQLVNCRDLESPFSNKDYAGGTTNRCTNECSWDQSRCHFCGDGILDQSIQLPSGAITLPEVCDKTAVNEQALEKHCRERCTGSKVGDIVLDCNFECSDNCQALLGVPDDDLECCYPTNELCPQTDDPRPCCWALENPDSTDLPCIEKFGKFGLATYCK